LAWFLGVFASLWLRGRENRCNPNVTTYQWCELTLDADLDLPELPQSGPAAGAPTWQVTMREGAAPRRPGRRWFHHWRFPDGRRWVAFARDPEGYILRFPHLADFDVRPETSEIHCHPGPDTPSHTLRHLLLDQVLPLVAGGRDRVALHGSVVAIDHGAIAFLGDPGRGKSMLAARLARRGCRLVSDDCCLLRSGKSGFDVVPSYPGVRLAPDAVDHVFGTPLVAPQSVAHYTTKVRIGDDRLTFQDTPLPIHRLYVIAPLEELEATSAITITPRAPREAFFDLVNYTFHLDVGHAPRLRETFSLAADIVEHIDMRYLSFPWNLSEADAVADAVLAEQM